MVSASMSAMILNFVVQYSIYSGYIISTFGIIGSALSILVFTQLKLFRDNRWAFYLTVESISDTLYQLLNISLSVLAATYGDDATGRSLIWCKMRLPLAQICALVTSSMICCATADQFFSTNYRLSFRQICTLKLGRCLALIFICIWILHSIMFGYFSDIQPLAGCVISNPIYLQYASFFLYPVLLGMLPIIIASCFSLLAFRNVRRIVRRQIPIVRRRLDQQMTAMILIRVIIFVCLALPYVSFRIYAINVPISGSQSMDFAIRQLLQTIFSTLPSLNFAISFYVFIIISSRFRRQVKNVLIKKFWRRLKSWFCCKNNQVAPLNRQSLHSNIESEEPV